MGVRMRDTPASMGLTMARWQAVTKKKELAYRGADRVGKSRILTELVEANRVALRHARAAL